jgi:hypothetical protein
MEEGSDC